MFPLLRRFSQKFSSLFLPNTCLLCGLYPSEHGICQACENDLPWQTFYCPQCAEPMAHSTLCGRCLKDAYPFDQAYIPFRYEGAIKSLITELKFHEKLLVGDLLAHLLINYFNAHTHFILPDYLLPVSLHPKRLQERGFNQALEISKRLSKVWKIPLLRHPLKKVFHTLPQSGQSKKARQKNLHGVFKFKGDLTGKHVGLVDDVVTTGSTASEIAQVLKHAGAKRVTIIAVARTAIT